NRRCWLLHRYLCRGESHSFRVSAGQNVHRQRGVLGLPGVRNLLIGHGKPDRKRPVRRTCLARRPVTSAQGGLRLHRYHERERKGDGGSEAVSDHGNALLCSAAWSTALGAAIGAACHLPLAFAWTAPYLVFC